MKYSELAINMCGYYEPDLFDKNNKFISKYQRIYIGNEYCSAFLHIFEKKINEILINIGTEKKISIVFPMIQEIHWEILKKICSKLSGITNIDEIIVNDIGTLVFCRKEFGNKHIVLGKFFCKSPREPRINMWDYDGINNTKVLSESVFDTDYFGKLMKNHNINRVEMEYISDEYAKDICACNVPYFIDIHYPYVYITSGTICPLNSISNSGDIQLISKLSCPAKCMHTIICIENSALTNVVINRGNAYMYKIDIDEENFEFSPDSNIRLVVNRLIYKENKKK